METVKLKNLSLFPRVQSKIMLKILFEAVLLHCNKFNFQIHLDRRKTAYGVSYVRHGITKFARADKEIIVSAGAINSPQLLLLSGIGPRGHLNETGIKCRVNLPVGQNLQDHPLTLVGPILVNESHSLMLDRDLKFSTLTDFVLNGTGSHYC